MPSGDTLSSIDAGAAGHPTTVTEAAARLGTWPGLETGGAFAGALGEELSATLSAELRVEAGERVGDYRVLRELGRGGMAVVYLAERADQAYQGSVALKLLASRLPGPEERARFEQERQILATLEHPHIARLLDGGSDPYGRPYIVMEHVAGEPIDAWCDARRLDLRARLRLFLDVAGAVQHAHRHLVVHRDLKPTNVLVNAAGQAKLLDFGIAKLLDARLAGAWAAPDTRTAVRVMTPQYASPELLRGRGVTTASDVYQLGLLLFELLTGRRAHRPSDDSLLALESAVALSAARRASAAWDEPGDERAAAARARGSNPRGLARALRGDLDRLVATALRPEPERRYASAAAMAEDVERYLAGRPLLARGDAWSYRAGKFARRNRVAVASAALVCLSLGAGLGAAWWQARAAARAGRTAEAVKDFLVGVFEVADPGESQGASVTARELLERGVARIDTLSDQPQVQAELLTTLAGIDTSLGLYDAAEPLARRALALRLRLAGGEDLDVAQSRAVLGEILKRQARFSDSEGEYRQALETRRRLLGARDALVAETLFELATSVLERDFAEALPILHEALELASPGGQPEGLLAGEVLNVLGMERHRAGDVSAAEGFYRRSEAVLRELGPRGETALVQSLHNLAALDRKRGRLAEAEAGFREVIALKARLYPDGHPSLADNWGYLGHVLKDRGDLDGAERCYRTAVEIHGRLLRPDHPFKGSSLDTLGKLLVARGRAAEAEPLLRASLAIRQKALGERHAKTLETCLHLGMALTTLGRLDEAEGLLRAAGGVPDKGTLGPTQARDLSAARAALAVARKHRA